MSESLEIKDLGKKLWDLDFELEFERLGKDILSAASSMYTSPPSCFAMSTTEIESEIPIFPLKHQDQQPPILLKYPYHHTEVFLSYLAKEQIFFARYSLDKNKPTKIVRLHFLEENLRKDYGPELRSRLNKELLPRVVQYFEELNRRLCQGTKPSS